MRRSTVLSLPPYLVFPALSITSLCYFSQCHYAECRVLFITMPSVIMLKVVAPLVESWAKKLLPCEPLPAECPVADERSLAAVPPQVGSEMGRLAVNLEPTLVNFLRHEEQLEISQWPIL